MPKVLGIIKGDEKTIAIAGLRAIWPFEALHKRGWDAKIVDQDVLQALMENGQLDQLLGWDMYVLQRLLYKVGPTGLFGALRENGAKVIFEVDDDLTDDYRLFGSGDWLGETVEQCNAVTVSTPHLGKLMERFGKPVYVLPNHIKTEWFARASMAADREYDGPVVGLVGTQTHWDNWHLVRDALAVALEEFPSLKVAICGYYPRYITDLVTRERLLIFAPVPVEHYPALLRQIDVLLCPLSDDPFNQSKSGVKALEGMSAARPVGKRVGGTAIIASNTKVYRRVVQHGHNGLLAKNDNWADSVVTVLKNDHLRYKLQTNGFRWVKKHRDISLAGPLWERAYKKTLAL